MNILRRSMVSACMRHFSIKNLANSNLMQVYIQSLIQFGSTRSKFLTFLNRSRSTCGWTILLLSMYVSLLQINVSHHSCALQWVVVHPDQTLSWSLRILSMSTSAGSGTWRGRPWRQRRSAEWRRNSSLNGAAGKPSGSSCRRRSAIFTRKENAS